MLPRRRPRLVACAALMLTLGLAGCATGEAPAKPGEPTVDSPGTTASQPSAAKGECSSPPRPPSKAMSFAKAPDPAIAKGKTFVATIKTNCGDIVLELDGEKAPQTVASFMHLAKEQYWKDSPCHRLTAGGSLSVLQCGDPTGSGAGDPGYGFGLENVPQDGKHPANTVAMARSQDPNSNGGQFFLVHADSLLPPDQTSGGYSIFAKITSGGDVLQKVATAGVESGGQDGPPAQPISILSVTVTEKKA